MNYNRCEPFCDSYNICNIRCPDYLEKLENYLDGLNLEEQIKKLKIDFSEKPKKSVDSIRGL